MGPNLSNSHETAFEAGRWQTITSAHLRNRARRYRLAAAVTDCPREEDMFCDLAMMFDQLAYYFRRFEKEGFGAPVNNEPKNHPLLAGDMTSRMRSTSA